MIKYTNKIDEFSSDLLHYIKKGELLNKTVIFLDEYENNGNNEIIVIFLNESAQKIKDFDFSIKVLSNNTNKISVLKFINEFELFNFINQTTIDLEQCSELKPVTLEKMGKILISTYRMDKYPILKINNTAFIKTLQDLILIEDKNLQHLLSACGNKTLYMSNVKYFFNQKITEKNYSSFFIEYNTEENFNLLVNDSIFEFAKQKKLPDIFEFIS